MGEAAGPGWVHQVGLLPKGKLDIPQVAAGWQPGDTDSQEGWEPEVRAGWAGRGGDGKVCGPVTGMLPGSHQAGASLCQAAFQGEGGQPKEKLAGMFSRNKNGLETTKLQNARVQIDLGSLVVWPKKKRNGLNKTDTDGVKTKVLIPRLGRPKGPYVEPQH